MFVALIQAPTS